MRFVSRLFTSFLSALFLLGAFGVFQPLSVAAQEVAAPGDQTTAGFEEIVGSGPQGSGAVGLIFANICSEPKPSVGAEDTCECRNEGKCTLDDVMQVFVNVTILILGISGSVILLMFVYGGFLWVTSRGEPKQIEKGKSTITNATIGFAIILLSYALINFLVAALAGNAATPGDTLEETLQDACEKGSTSSECRDFLQGESDTSSP